MNLSRYDIAILRTLSGNCGFTTARLARMLLDREGMFGINMRQHSGAVRSWLNQLYKAGLIKQMDREKPVCWMLTPAGTAALASGEVQQG